MSKQLLIALVFISAIVGATVAYAKLLLPLNPRHFEITSFYPDHTHSIEGGTIDGPQHSGGTDIYGCHNGSIPYHCH